MLKLYDYFRSSACFRVRIALNLKQIPHELIPIHLVNNGGEQYALQYQKINPQSLVPSLRDDDKIVTQSLAIIEYLDEVYPDHSLFPIDLYEKALVRSFALAITADLHPLNNMRILKYLTNELHISEEQKNQWYQHWIQKGLTALEKKLVTHHPSTDFCFGDKPTVADICLVPQMYNARRFNCDMSAYPTLIRIDANCQKLPAFMRAWPMEAVT
jgi:maleylacetoacetate isomerase